MRKAYSTVGGRPRAYPLREILNAIFYIVRSGCSWRLLPHDFPPWRSVYQYFRRFRLDGTWARLHAAVSERVRVCLKRNPQPSAGIVDSQSVKTTGVGGEERSYDGGKKIRGRKRHLLVDTEGFVLKAKVHSAKLLDQEAIKALLDREKGLFPRLSHLWPERVALSIKAAGDFTREIGHLKPGATAYLDGPHGAFSMDRHHGPGFVFVGAGVGITPLMSMLRTMADRNDPRPCYLFFGNREWEGVAFREEIEELKSKLNLKVMHVLSRPLEGWEGEEGRIEAALLARYLPDRYQRLQYFICGSDQMMDVAEDALVHLRVPKSRVHSERFSMV